MVLSLFKRLTGFVLCCFLLAACQTTTVKHGLTPEQIATLKAEGFVETDDGWMFSINDKLLFDLNDSRLKEDQREAIRRLTRVLLGVQINAARVEGHTDDTGRAAFNDKLSRERAESVAGAMAEAGMPRQNLRVEGLGSHYPIVPNTTEENRRENRRVTIIVGGTIGH